MTHKVPEKHVKLGEYPFPITEGPEESRYLTWIRNHSNYMAVRGLLDYLRAVSVLMRGVLVNFLIFLPYLLMLAVLVAVSSFMNQPAPYVFTKTLVVMFAVWIFLFPIATPFFRIIRYKKTRATGSDSSVRQRDKYERVFGGFLLLIGSVAAIESLPDMLDLFHEKVSFPTLASTTAFVTAIFSIAPKIVSFVGDGLAKKLAIFVVGALGLLVPLLVVLTVASFLVYGPPADWSVWAAFAGLFFPILALFAIAIGVVVGAFKRQDLRGVIQLIAAAVGLVLLVNATDDYIVDNYLHNSDNVRLQALEALQKDEEAIAAVALEAGQQPGLYLQDYMQRLGEVTLRDDTVRTARMEELADLAQDAGFYPEFGELVDELDENLRGCGHESAGIDALEPVATFDDSDSPGSLSCTFAEDELALFESNAQLLAAIYEADSTAATTIYHRAYYRQ